VLGPLLFILYINDIGSGICSSMKLFADDSIIYRPITCPEDHTILQQDIYNLTIWATNWQMNFEPSKCYALSITLKKNPSTFHYYMHGTSLALVTCQKYLGVYITSNLSWSHHCHEVIKKANRVLGLLQRNLSSCSPTVKKRAYKALVRPIPEYGSTAWSPHTAKDKNGLESIQRRAARFVCKDYQRASSIPNMINSLGWDSLEKRRVLADITMFYKIHGGLIDVPFPSEMTSSDQRTRSANLVNSLAIYC